MDPTRACVKKSVIGESCCRHIIKWELLVQEWGGAVYCTLRRVPGFISTSSQEVVSLFGVLCSIQFNEGVWDPLSLRHRKYSASNMLFIWSVKLRQLQFWAHHASWYTSFVPKYFGSARALQTYLSELPVICMSWSLFGINTKLVVQVIWNYSCKMYRSDFRLEKYKINSPIS